MSEAESSAPARTGLSPKLVGAVVLGIAMLLFWAANRRQTKITFLFFDATVRVWVALLVASAIGFGLGFLVARHRD